MCFFFFFPPPTHFSLHQVFCFLGLSNFSTFCPCPPAASGAQRNVRTIFRTEAASLMSAAELPSGASRQFHLK